MLFTDIDTNNNHLHKNSIYYNYCSHLMPNFQETEAKTQYFFLKLMRLPPQNH